MTKPLEGLLVIDFSQFLAGPSASLRLADLGARVIKVERPESGDIARQLYMCNQRFLDESLLFHSVNRDKESVALDLKDQNHLRIAKDLLKKADVMIQNFRPGVIERLGLGYDDVSKINPRIIYGTVSGYGTEGDWRDLPGQDLLVQARSGLTWLSGNSDDPPVPVGVSVIDMFTGAHLVQGILAALIRRGTSGKGGIVEVSLLESALDLQFELISVHLNDGGAAPRRCRQNSGNPYLSAPYGIYKTEDGYLALAMNSIAKLGQFLGIEALSQYSSPDAAFDFRDEIMRLIAGRICREATQHWLDILEPQGVWCAGVLHWKDLFASKITSELGLLQTICSANGESFRTTRCPIRIDGQIFHGVSPAPTVGEHTQSVLTAMEVEA